MRACATDDKAKGFEGLDFQDTMVRGASADDGRSSGSGSGSASMRSTAEYTKDGAIDSSSKCSSAATAGGARAAREARGAGAGAVTGASRASGSWTSAEQLAVDEEGRRQLVEALERVLGVAHTLSHSHSRTESQPLCKRSEEVCVRMRLKKGRAARVRVHMRLALCPLSQLPPSVVPSSVPELPVQRWGFGLKQQLCPVVLWHQHEELGGWSAQPPALLPRPAAEPEEDWDC